MNLGYQGNLKYQGRPLIPRERGATILTSNRHITEWVSLFDDQILANSALDRLAHNAHQMIIEGESYRKKKASTRTII